MRLKVESCDLGLSDEHGVCAIDTSIDRTDSTRLNQGQRAARAVAGLAFVAVSIPLGRVRVLRPLAGVGLWFGLSHLVAGATGYVGCPELGAIPSMVARRPLYTVCEPWDWIDGRLGLRDTDDSQARRVPGERGEVITG